MNIGHCVISQRAVQYRSFSKKFIFYRTKTFILRKRKYATAANGLQQRVINLFYRILTDPSTTYPWSTHYGALIGLCQMNDKVT